MTIEQRIRKHLTGKGLWEHEAACVVAAIVAGNPAMSDRWDDSAEGYPTPLLATLIADADRIALKWLTANKPKHRALPMFAQSLASGCEPGEVPR